MKQVKRVFLFLCFFSWFSISSFNILGAHNDKVHELEMGTLELDHKLLAKSVEKESKNSCKNRLKDPICRRKATKSILAGCGIIITLGVSYLGYLIYGSFLVEDPLLCLSPLPSWNPNLLSIENKMLSKFSTSSPLLNKICENQGSFDEENKNCTCYPGYEGNFCEIEGECNLENKQRALYADFTYCHDSQEKNLFDLQSSTRWDNIHEINDYGKNGIYEAHSFGINEGPNGYYGTIITAEKSGTFLFSVWDSDLNKAIPFHENCKRNCNDCALYKEISNEQGNTTGVQCSIDFPIKEGETYTMRMRRVGKNTSYFEEDKQTYSGNTWRVTAKNEETGEEITIGEMLFDKSLKGLQSFNYFHEHIGCTHCSAFRTKVTRGFPEILEPKDSYFNEVTTTDPCGDGSCSCDLYQTVIDYKAGAVIFE